MNHELPHHPESGVDPGETARLQLQATAYHEAGHAVMAVSLGRLIQSVTIAPGKSQFGKAHLGVCKLRKGRSRAAKDALEEDAMILLAGMVAEARFTGTYCQGGAAQDLRSMRRMLDRRAGSEGQMARLERRLIDKTEHRLLDQQHAAAIALVARELLQHTTLSGRAIQHFFTQAGRADGN